MIVKKNNTNPHRKESLIKKTNTTGGVVAMKT